MKLNQVRNKIFRILRVFVFWISFFPFVALAAPDIDHDKIRLQALNKATAQTSVIEVGIGETVKLGPLYIRPQACRTNPPVEEPEAAGFLQVWTVKQSSEEEQTEQEPESVWVFSGWMFASSPGIMSMDHPVYDLWVLDCGKQEVNAAMVDSEIVRDDLPEEGELDTDLVEEGEPLKDSEMPIVKLDGEQINVPDEDIDSRFEAYEDETAPIVHID